MDPITGQPISAEVRTVQTPEITAVRGIILRQIDKLKEDKEKQKTLKESMTNLLDNDSMLQDVLTQAETILQRIKDEKTRVKNGSEYIQLQVKEKELKSAIKDVQESLNNHLINYRDLTGVSIVTDEDGNDIHFSIRANMKSGQLKLL